MTNRPNEQEIQEALDGITVRGPSVGEFALKHRDALKVLMAGKLFDKIPGSPAKYRKDWRNVVEHCLEVGRALNALAELLELSEEDRQAIVEVGNVHDWYKRFGKKKENFPAGEEDAAQAFANEFLMRFDPTGLLLDATEPGGLPRFTRGLKGEYLEGEEPVSSLEKYIHVLDLSLLPNGKISTVDDRIAELRVRQANLGPEFWDEKLIAAKAHEQDILQELRDKGYDIPEGTRLNEIIGRAAGIPIAD